MVQNRAVFNSVGRAVASNPEIRGSNPVIGKILYLIYLLLTVAKTKIKIIEAGIGPFLKKRKWFKITLLS